MNRDRLPLLLIPLAALLVIHPLLVHGCSCGHDLSFHLLSWQEAATQIAHGNLHPRWAATPAWGAGEPRFVFYPPLSWTLGALLTLLASAFATLLHLDSARAFAATPTAYIFLALNAAGFSMWHLARRFVSPPVAILAAVVYLANPYTLFTAWERSAFAELLAAGLLPFLLNALLPSPGITLPTTASPSAGSPLGASPHTASHPASLLALAIPLALLWLTNAPAAILGSYTVAFVLCLRLIPLLRSRTTRPVALRLALSTIAATLLALALAAFYIGPVLLERPWVQTSMAILPGLRPEDNTLFHHTADAFHDQVLHTASVLAVLLLTLAALGCLLALVHARSLRQAQIHADLSPKQIAPAEVARKQTFGQENTPATALALLTIAVAFLLTPLSLPLWHHLPEFAFVQFPWRLLALLAPVCVLALALTIPYLQLRPRPAAALALLLPLALAAAAFHLFRQPCDPEDTPQSRFAVFHSRTGDEPTDEYTPATADNDSLKDNNPPLRLLPLTTSDDASPPPDAAPGPAPLSLSLNLPDPANLVFNLRDYPTWIVLRNGRPDPDRIHRADGLLTLPLPAGPSRLTLAQQTPSPEYAADAVSAVALCITLGLALSARKRFTRASAAL